MAVQHSVLDVKAVVAAFNQEKALVGAFSVITNLRIAFVSVCMRILCEADRADDKIKCLF